WTSVSAPGRYRSVTVYPPGYPHLGAANRFVAGVSALGAQHATEAEVAGGGVHRLALPRRRPVPVAVVRRAQVRSAFDDPHRARPGPTARVRLPGGARPAAGTRLTGVVRRPRGGRPLPYIAGHVEQPESVGRKQIGRASWRARRQSTG